DFESSDDDSDSDNSDDSDGEYSKDESSNNFENYSYSIFDLPGVLKLSKQDQIVK
ncbi:18004_t:CDS:1, partial [Funneliformis geosporum]